jgi:protein TonB
VIGSAQQQLGPWFIAAVLLHALVLLTLPWPQSGDRAYVHSQTQLSILLNDSRAKPSAAKPEPATNRPVFTTPKPAPKHPLPTSEPVQHMPKTPATALALKAKKTPEANARAHLENPVKPPPPVVASSSHASATTGENGPSQQTKQAAQASRDNAYNELTKLLHGAINRHKQYPRTALRMAWQGTASIGFLLQRDGQLASLTLLHSSGYNSLDRAALQAVRNISPFEPAQQYLQNAQTFKVDVVFNLYN